MRGRLYSLLKILLVIGFVYWLILVSILVYLLLLARTVDTDHLCVWVGCTFILLIVFGAVLFLGSLVIYYIQDLPTPDFCVGNFEYWHSTPLPAFHVDFQRLVDLNTLVPILCKNQVLYGSDLHDLHNLYREPRATRVGKLLAILDTKGKEGISLLIESLKEDQEHIGHWELAKILEDKYGIQVAGYQRAIAKRNEVQWA